MAVTFHENANYWFCKGKNYLLFDTKRRVFINQGNEVINFRGQTSVIESVTRGPDYNGTAKVAPVGGWDLYSTVFNLVALPALRVGKTYQLDIMDRPTLVRHLETVRIAHIGDDLVLDVYDDATGEHYNLDWQDVYIANEVGKDELIPTP